MRMNRCCPGGGTVIVAAYHRRIRSDPSEIRSVEGSDHETSPELDPCKSARLQLYFLDVEAAVLAQKGLREAGPALPCHVTHAVLIRRRIPTTASCERGPNCGRVRETDLFSCQRGEAGSGSTMARVLAHGNILWWSIAVKGLVPAAE